MSVGIPFLPPEMPRCDEQPLPSSPGWTAHSQTVSRSTSVFLRLLSVSQFIAATGEIANKERACISLASKCSSP